MKYISEYILKLQIHQHSLLTRKVFSWHNLSAKVFFYVSSSHIHIQFIFIWIWIITRSGSSSLNLDHHWIWIIITGSGSSSLDYHQRWMITGSTSKLDHHQSWIITGSSSSLLPLSRTNGAISQFYSSQEVLQRQPFFMMVVGLASM